MLQPNNLDSVPHNPWADDLDERGWAEMAERLQNEAEASTSEVDTPESITHHHDLRLDVRLEDHSPRLLSDYSTGNAPTGTSITVIRNNVANESATQDLEHTPGWWNRSRLSVIQKQFREPIFTEVLPSEEFVVGQGARAIRIFKFGEPLSAERQKDCKDFVDLATQFMGDRAYDFMSDVVIGDFVDTDAAEKDQHGSHSFADPGNGLILVNTAVLHDDAPTDKNAHGSPFLKALVHELGHMVHGNVRRDPQALEDLEVFAEAIGWDMEGMRENNHNWLTKSADNQPYAPHHVDPDLPELSPPGGSPTEYGTRNPKESLADTTKHMMLGGTVMGKMTKTDDAWLEHLQKRMLKPGETLANRPIATSLDRKPITVTRYTGADIQYPS